MTEAVQGSGDSVEDAPEYDFVIVGAGAGGGPLAANLAEAGFIDILPGSDPASPFVRPAEVPRPTDPMFVNAIALLGQKERPLSSALPILLPRLDDVLLVRLGNHGVL
ncbi:hypothetical protein ETC03_23440, partial [Geobacillus sp. MMMUD3]|nr:hypothetical protein [Geobacillus sp. MMMUD3]